MTPQMAADSWRSQQADYDYATNRCKTGKMCGHYTQVVWKSTTQVGCAYAVCEDTKDQIWVCQYQPAGNWVRKKPYQDDNNMQVRCAPGAPAGVSGRRVK